MVDLHIHSTESDGYDTPKEILEKAEKLKLKVISITDHETVNAYNVLGKDVSGIFSGKLITGIELKTYYDGKIIDILGYGFDPKLMEQNLKEFYKEKTHAFLQKKYLKEFYKKAECLNLKVTPITEVKWNPDKNWASIIFYEELKKYTENYEKLPKGLLDSFDAFCSEYHNIDSLFYIDKSGDYPTLEQAIEIIHKSGGKAFVAHIYIYKCIDNKISFLDECINKFEIDGIECFYPSFSEKQTKTLLEYCAKNNLLISGGSDYHSLNKPTIPLGLDYDYTKYLSWI